MRLQILDVTSTDDFKFGTLFVTRNAKNRLIWARDISSDTCCHAYVFEMTFSILSRLGRKTNQSSFSLAYLGLMVALLQASFWPSIAMPSVATRVYDRTRKHSLKAVSTTSATFYLIVNFLAGLQFPIQVCFSTTVCDPSSCWVFVFLLRPWALTHDPDLRT